MPCLFAIRTASTDGDADWTELNAMIILTLGTLWFVAADREQDAQKDGINFRKETEYPSYGSDEEDLLMSWKEADEVTNDDLRIGKKSDKSGEQGLD